MNAFNPNQVTDLLPGHWLVAPGGYPALQVVKTGLETPKEFSDPSCPRFFKTDWVNGYWQDTDGRGNPLPGSRRKNSFSCYTLIQTAPDTFKEWLPEWSECEPEVFTRLKSLDNQLTLF